MTERDAEAHGNSTAKVFRRMLGAVLLLLPLAVHGQVLRIAVRQDADTLDPTLSRTYVSRVVLAGLCDKLFDINAKLDIVPQLATGYEYADPTHLTIHLHDGVKFQDGTDMDAAAVKYSLDRHLTFPGSFRRSEIAPTDHVEIVDPHTIRVVLASASAPFLSQLADRAGMIMSPKAAEAAGKDFGLHPVCAGPFMFSERVAQDRIVLQRFPEYWNAAAIHFDRVVYSPIPNSSIRLTNLQAGATDLVEYIVPTDAAAVKQDPKLSLVVADAIGYEGITYNIGHGPLAATPLGQDVRVRRAFDKSIDRAALMQVVYNDMYVPTGQAVPPESPFHDPAIGAGLRDIDGARALLKQAGVAGRIPVNLVVPNSPDLQQLAEVIQAMAADAGFDVRIQAMEFASSVDNAERGGFGAYLIDWSGRVDPDGNLWNILHTDAPLNFGRYSSVRMDALLDQARSEMDPAKRKAMYHQIALLGQQDLPISYLYTTRTFVGLSRRINGFKPYPDGIIRLQGMSIAP